MLNATPIDESAPAPPATLPGAVAAGRGRASWSGLLRLSLVAVPVKAYPATATSSESRCHQLHADCGQRIRYEKHCPLHGKVDSGAIVSGYEYAKDQYLVLDDAELDQLRPAADRALSLEHFLDAGQIDPALFAGRSLYLLPDGPAAQLPFAVLVQALHARRKWAVGRVVLSQRRQMVLVRPRERMLALHVLHYPAQVRSSAALEGEIRAATIPEVESQLAGVLLDACSQAVVWSDYHDDSAEQLAALIDAKLQGRPPATTAAQERHILSLLEALKQSVAAAKPSALVPQTKATPSRKGRKKAARRSA